MKTKTITGLLCLTGVLTFSPLVTAADAAAAQALMKKEACMKCHALDKKKESVSLKDIGKKYAGKPDAEAKILHQITAGENVKFEDGTEEAHKVIKSKDKADVSNMIGWILSLN